MVTIRDISLKCNVSVSTVSKVLNGYSEISEETARKVLKIAHDLGYVTESYARHNNQKRSYNLGVLFHTENVDGLKNEYFAHILSSLRYYAGQKGYDITFIENNTKRWGMSLLDHCIFRNVDGVCILCTEYSDPEVVELVNSQTPVVTIDHSFSEVISINSDNYNGMKKLMEYIISRGHTRIAYIHGNRSAVTHNRMVAFCQTLKEHNIALLPSYLVAGQYHNSEVAKKAAKGLLSRPDYPTCIVASDDFAALGVIEAIKEAGRLYPDEVSVAGYDGIATLQALTPKLTTVEQDTDKIGEEAIRRLLALVENPMSVPLNSVIVPTKLVAGESVHAFLDRY